MCRRCNGSGEVREPYAACPKIKQVVPCQRCGGSGAEPEWTEVRGVWSLTVSGQTLTLQRCNPSGGWDWWTVRVGERPTFAFMGSLESAQEVALVAIGAGKLA